MPQRIVTEKSTKIRRREAKVVQVPAGKFDLVRCVNINIPLKNVAP